MNKDSIVDKVVVFGAGSYGKGILEFAGKEKILLYVDNDPQKRGKEISGIPILWFEESKDEIRNRRIVIAVSEEKRSDIERQLKENGFSDVVYITEYKRELIAERISTRADYIKVYQKSISWIKKNTIDGEGIICHSKLRISYPEVTGYYIPTLLNWGYRDLAIQYAKWLCSIQKEDGSWFDTEDKWPYIFDSGQILKGLLAIRHILPSVDDSIIRGVDWILSNMEENGRLPSPRENDFGDGKTFHEVIHLYCLSPIIEAGEVFGIHEYKEKSNTIIRFYLNKCTEKIESFDLLSHFYAYVMEALLDLGETDIVKKAMDNIAGFQLEDGCVPGYKNVSWACAPGLFQLALVWFRLGELKKGNKVFSYACKLQNESGGWYGSYLNENHPEENNDYFPDSEISWANKYFLDALYYKGLCEFEQMSDQFLSTIDKDDGRYVVIRDEILKVTGMNSRILDIGCGKGRYLKNLIEDITERDYYAVDVSKRVMSYINDDRITCKQGAITNIPWPTDFFDLVYCCESLEHAIDINSAVKEMIRVTRPGGRIVIVDKPIEKLGVMEIGDLEQWIDTDKVITELSSGCSMTSVTREIPYEGGKTDGLFCAWAGTVK